MVDRMASVLFFQVWNAYNAYKSGLIPMGTPNGIHYETRMCLDYGVDIAFGENHFRKIGVQIINPEDPQHPEYFDALKICRQFAENDLVDMDGGFGFAIDMPYFTYRLFKKFAKAHWEPFDMDEPESIQEMMGRIYKEEHKELDDE